MLVVQLIRIVRRARAHKAFAFGTIALLLAVAIPHTYEPEPVRYVVGATPAVAANSATGGGCAPAEKPWGQGQGRSAAAAALYFSGDRSCRAPLRRAKRA